MSAQEQPETPTSHAAMEQLRRQVDALQATLSEMSGSAVDAVMIGDSDEGSEQLYTFTQGADRPYRVIVESMGEGAVTVSLAGLIHYANPQFADFLGVERDTMLGRDLTDYVDPGQLERLRELLADSNAARREELVLTAADGRSVPFLVAATGIDLDGTLVRCLVLTDLTTQKAYEAQLAAEVASQAAADERLRVAQEVNDTIVQGLVAAEMALDLDQVERAREYIARTSERARSWIGDLAGGGELQPGMAVRSSHAEPHEDSPTGAGGDS